MMIGYKTALASGIGETIANGNCDEDLETLQGVINDRIKVRDGLIIYCPECGGKLAQCEFHEHERIRFTHIAK